MSYYVILRRDSPKSSLLQRQSACCTSEKKARQRMVLTEKKFLKESFTRLNFSQQSIFLKMKTKIYIVISNVYKDL